MKTYRVRLHELVWQYTVCTVEAENEEEVSEMINSGEYEVEWTDFDTVDQTDIESIKEIDDEN